MSVVAPWMIMSVAVASVTVIVNDVNPPIRMTSFPYVNVTKPDWITDHPGIARSQIVILVAHKTGVFITVPVVIVRNHRHLHRRRSHNHPGFDSHPPSRPNDTA